MSNSDALEFHDSEVSSIGLDGRHFVVRFSAGYVHRSGETPGIDDGAGFLRSLELTCLDPSEVDQEPGCSGGLCEGALYVGGAKLTLVPIPYETEAGIELDLTFANGSACRVVARGLALKPTGEARFVEWLKC